MNDTLRDGSILGIDPGTRKTGYAIIGTDGSTLVLGIEETEAIGVRVSELVKMHTIVEIALGEGTNATAVGAALASLGLPIHLVDERSTSLQARGLYFADNPPRGWRRLIPLGLQLPPRPIDDYAAVLIARRFLASRDLEEAS